MHLGMPHKQTDMHYWQTQNSYEGIHFENKICEKSFQGHIMKVKICILAIKTHEIKKTKMTKTIDFPNEPFFKASKTKTFFFPKKSELN